MLGGALRKSIETSVVTASVTWFIVREESEYKGTDNAPFIKEMHTRLGLSIQEFCIAFDY